MNGMIKPINSLLTTNKTKAVQKRVAILAERQ